MKKTIFKLGSVFGVLCLLITGSAPALAAGSLNNFYISDYKIDYFLGQDSENRSTLKTVEVISAVFPEFDQNHGIERAIPDTYDGHSTSLKISSITDNKDKPLNYTTYKSNSNTVVRIGDADRYVHGLQTYKITYTQRDVTKYFSDTNDDEFYWDTNGTEWKVRINRLSVRIHLDDNLADKVKSQACYLGYSGAMDQCTISSDSKDWVVNISDLATYENMTFAIGFAPHTFAEYKMTLLEKLAVVWAVLLFITLPIAFILVVWFLVRAYRRSNRLSEISTIVPEYIPPKDVSISTSGSISHKPKTIFSAQLVDLAVRHYIKIYQTREKSFLRQANYELEIIKDISTLKAEEQEVLEDIFDSTEVGAKLDMSTLKSKTYVAINLSDNKKKLDKDITGKYALRARDEKESTWFKKAGVITFGLSVLTLSPWLFGAAIISFVIYFVLKPLTDSGLELARYLKGLELYIKVAETERLKMLQSPEGAAKLDAPIDTNDKRQLIKLYERVLPYAILFGQEKEWNKQLGQYYESINESPSWYSGQSGAFNAIAFSSAISSFNHVATYSAPSSSSSGGSGGGGFSGGGGGGGGGGGW